MTSIWKSDYLIHIKINNYSKQLRILFQIQNIRQSEGSRRRGSQKSWITSLLQWLQNPKLGWLKASIPESNPGLQHRGRGPRNLDIRRLEESLGGIYLRNSTPGCGCAMWCPYPLGHCPILSHRHKSWKGLSKVRIFEISKICIE